MPVRSAVFAVAPSGKVFYDCAVYFVCRVIEMNNPTPKILSFRAPESFIAEVASYAKLIGMNQSDYVRRAVVELNDRLMNERIANLSRELSAQSLAVANSMDGALGDGLNRS